MPEIGKTIAQGELLKTGQTTQYGGYADDGYYKKGLPRAYNILTTGQHAGTTSITINAKTDIHSNNCVYDLRTRLMWSRYASAGVGPGSQGWLPWTTNVDGEGIFNYVAAANAAKLAGYSDWRVPNLLELFSLSVIQAPSGLPDPVAFPEWSTDPYYWSSTTKPNQVALAMALDFGPSDTAGRSKADLWAVILVRGG